MIPIYLFLLIIISNYQLNALEVNNKTVVSYGGPNTYTDADRYNEGGTWNQTYHPAYPQQVHISWTSDGIAFTVQFTTMKPIQNSRLLYWSHDGLEEELVNESQVHKNLINALYLFLTHRLK